MRRRSWRAAAGRPASPPALPLGVLAWPARPVPAIPIPRERASLRSFWRGVVGGMMRGDGRARDLAELRRRRVEQANTGSDEIEAIG
jgi:hypothetical protein